MKGDTYSDAESRTLWKFDRQQGVDKEKQFWKMRIFHPEDQKTDRQEDFMSSFLPLSFFFRCAQLHFGAVETLLALKELWLSVIKHECITCNLC